MSVLNSLARQTRKNKFSLLAELKKQSVVVDKGMGSTVPDEITRITGVNLNISVATDAQQLPMIIAAGDLAELVFTMLIEETGDPKYVEAEGIRWWGLFIGSAVVEALFNYNPAREQGIAAALVAREHMEFYPGLGLLGMRTPDDKQAILTRLNEMVRTEEIKIILAETETEAVQAYQDMLNLVEEIGVVELEEWSNQEYTGIKGTNDLTFDR